MKIPFCEVLSFSETISVALLLHGMKIFNATYLKCEASWGEIKTFFFILVKYAKHVLDSTLTQLSAFASGEGVIIFGEQSSKAAHRKATERVIYEKSLT